MLVYLRTSIFDSPAQTLVNTVNTEGVMGKGIAKVFKEQYPAMFKEYKKLCDSGEFDMFKLHLWRGPQKWVLNFPTKTTWRKPSKIEYIEHGLKKFRDTYEDFGITSVSFPPLGCGNGNLDWDEVKPLMEGYLKNLPINIYIHDKQVQPAFVPEHLEPENKYVSLPMSSSDFLKDIHTLVQKHKGTFYTIEGNNPFFVEKIDENSAYINRSDKTHKIPSSVFEDAWSILQKGLYTKDMFSDNSAKNYKTYIFAILKELPYVKFAQYQHIKSLTSPAHALYLKSVSGLNDEGPIIVDSKNIKQMQLWE